MKHVKAVQEELEEGKSKVIAFSKKVPKFAKKSSVIAQQTIRHPITSVKKFNQFISDKPITQATLGTLTAAGGVGLFRIVAPRAASAILGSASARLLSRRLHKQGLRSVHQAKKKGGIVLSQSELDKIVAQNKKTSDINIKGMNPNEFIRRYFF